VFHVPSAPDLSGIPKYPGQLWVAWSRESDINYRQLSNIDYMKRFDLAMTYRMDSDVPTPYFDRDTPRAILGRPLPKVEQAPLVFMASNSWDKMGRLRYVHELMRHMPVDSYGKALNNRELVDDRGRDTKLELYSRYKFTLGIENSRSWDYVTEKLFDPFEAGSVPVYYGAPNIADFVPGDHCFVNMDEFSGPKDLAQYLLRAASDEAEYASYFAWKEQPLSSRFLEMVQRVSEDWLWRLCALIRARRESGLTVNQPIQQAARWLEQARKDKPHPAS